MKQVKRLYTQTEIAHKLEISKGTLSKWINKNNVSPERIQGNRKLYKETIIADYNKDKKTNKEDKKQSFSTIEFLKNEVKRQQTEIERLNKKLDEKDKQINNYAGQFAKLADQAQQLNLADKPQLMQKKEVVSDENKETKQETVKKASEEVKSSNKKSWFKKIWGK
ncbi:helix-turn-helix domain-containing protein [Lactobacillus johnsonii]|uniref:helix-turn-helix domain-containing protein n=1 Tax=Lactobacillus johnsonii TaxID=33959 RepID=UPI0011DDEBF4|nr:helix-turn-helix domain-containing protein [Lactobacillus johnsonii]